ncbi:hypothetical protein EDD85DRAFT_822854 [Armillaria nabsnona]|nr:hypothetical protein EDD85DRAFT_822854 [Armillaria nabsnona]
MSPDLIRKYLQREYWNHHYYFSVLFAGTNRDDPVYGYDHNPPSPSPLHNREEHTILFKITKPFLFYASDGYLEILKMIATDRLRSRDQWAAAVDQITQKLNLSNGVAAVLLAANMAFLAIPSVDVMGANQQLSVTKTLVCFSVVVSLGSIIIGLFLSNAHTTLKQGSRSTLLSFIERHCRASRVIEQLAIKYSIPHALLMLGMVSFLVSFLCMCLEGPSAHLLKAFAILACILITALGLWCIHPFWEGSDQPGGFFERQKVNFTGLRSILSHENLRRLRDKIWRTDSRTGGSYLPTTTGKSFVARSSIMAL